ncbi:MAG: uracil-DNA glycosylase [Muribaculaceae bacterium]|nr:uracil-DNA glycosylase [Muribaculaceae bacterium]
MNVKIDDSWRKLLASEWEAPYFGELAAFVRDAYARGPVFPPASRIFAAFDACPVDKVKVVIIGQDPYHGPGQANGLCFSVNPGIPFPPSLRNILSEVSSDTGAPTPADGDLSRWAEQGVLLLNTTLTVAQGAPKSHSGRGWERLTSTAVQRLSEARSGLVFLLWGSDAMRMGAGIDRSRHLVLTAPHPSPLSAYRGFFGCRHFSQANDYLTSRGLAPINW